MDGHSSEKTLILYVFHEPCNNLDLFIKRGLVRSSHKRFIFICNNVNIDLKKWDFIKDYENVSVFIRPNVGHDFQGWNEALHLPVTCLNYKMIYDREMPMSRDSGDLYLSNETDLLPPVHTLFDKFIFINSTVAGPYLPLYVDKDWIDCFTSKFSKDVKMIGMSVNFKETDHCAFIYDTINEQYGFRPSDHVHIQSMAYALDKEGLNILLSYGLFKKRKQFPANKWVLICTAEIAMSSILRHEGKSLYSYLIGQGLIPCNMNKLTPNWWFVPGSHPLCETIFIKTNSPKTFIEKERYDT